MGGSVYSHDPMVASLDANTLIEEQTVAKFLSGATGSAGRMLRLGSHLRSQDVLEALLTRATSEEHDWESFKCAWAETQTIETNWDTTSLAASVLLSCVLDPEKENFSRCAEVLLTGRAKLDLNDADAAEMHRLAIQTAAIAHSEELLRWCASFNGPFTELIWAARVDLMRTSPQFTLKEWWREFNSRLLSDGLEPFELDLGNVPDTSFGSIQVPVVEGCETDRDHQPLISVIMPAYNPDEMLIQAVKSLTCQSWSKVEILVIDDGSVSGHEYFEAAERLDPRVRVIREHVNGGAYRARNRGIAESVGEYITFQDIDDLSHPRRLERQSSPLLKDKSVIATTSLSQRVTSSCDLTYLGYLPIRTNASSLMFRRQEVIERLGQFDNVRKGADTEFAERLRFSFGDDAIKLVESVLCLVQLTISSLSRSDFRFKWISGPRVAYMNQYQGAHRRIETQLGSWVLSQDRPRLFQAPAPLLGMRPPENTSVAVLADWKKTAEGAERFRDLLPGLVEESDSPIGLLHGMNPRLSSTRRTPVDLDTVWQTVEDGETYWMSWSDRTFVDTLIVPNPSILAFLPRGNEIGIQVRRVVIVVEQTARRARVASLPPLRWLEQKVSERLGATTEWLAGSMDLLRSLRSSSTVSLGNFRGSSSSRFVGQVSQLSPQERTHQTSTTLGIPLPLLQDRRNWTSANLSKLLAPFNRDSVVLYDEHGVSENNDGQFSDWNVVTGTELSRDDFLETIDVLLVDPYGQRLISNSAWIWACATRADTVAVCPRSLESEYGSLASRFLPRTLGNLLTLMMLDGDLRGERANLALQTALKLGRLASALPGLEDTR